jgi:ABC-type cobalamin/Fe3+-siderophores transport system ATPase subunit
MIVGPHGSGKSTLVATLLLELERLQPIRRIHSLRLTSAIPSWSATQESIREWERDGILVLDGYEQLSWLGRSWLNRQCRARSMSVLATMHQPRRGFELIWRTQVDEHSSEWVIRELLGAAWEPAAVTQLLSSIEWADSRKRHGQNLRETLFDMYDWWQETQTEPKAIR